MNYIVDGIVILLLLALTGRGVSLGLVMSAARLISLAGGVIAAHLTAACFKGVLAEKMILPWIAERLGQSSEAAYNPAETIMSGVSEFGMLSEQELIELMESMGIPGFSLSSVWGRLIDKMTGTGTDILEAAQELVTIRISYVLIFIIVFLVIQLALLIVFTGIDGLKNLPLAGFVNKLGGGIVGASVGVLVIGILMITIMLFIPSASGQGGILSQEVMTQTKVARPLYEIADNFLNGL